ncbi:MAG: hypothetical protein AAB213_04440 [Candidatus Omnitrophota bacterium]
MMKLSILRHTLSLIFICCLGFFIYSDSLSHSFSSMDDRGLINTNKDVIKGNNIHKILSEPLAGFNRYYRPLQIYSYKLDYLLWGLNPFGYHLTSVALHLINACLLYVFLFLLFNSRGGPFFAAVIFVCHPVFTEPVNYIASRSDLLVGTSFLLTIIFYLLNQRSGKKVYLVLSYGAFLFSLLSKEVSLLLPFFILFLERLTRKKYSATTIYFILALVFILFRSFLVTFKIHEMPSVYFFLTLPKALFLYMEAFLFPFGLQKKWCLSLVTSVFDKDFFIPAFIISGFIYVIIGIRRYSGVCSFGLAWFLFTPLALTLVLSQLWPKGVMPFSYAWLYVPSIGLFTMLAYSAQIALARSQNRKLVFAAISIIIPVFSFNTMVMNKKWSDPSFVSYEKTILAELPENVSLSIQATNKGYRLLEEQKTQQAEQEFRRALALLATNHKALNNLGIIFLNQRRFDQALFYFKMSNSIKPFDPNTHYNTGLVYLMQNDTRKAIVEFEKTVKLDFYHFDAHYNLLILYARENMEEKALRELSAIKYLDPAFDITKMNEKNN